MAPVLGELAAGDTQGVGACEDDLPADRAMIKLGARGHFPSDDAVVKLILVVRQVEGGVDHVLALVVAVSWCTRSWYGRRDPQDGPAAGPPLEAARQAWAKIGLSVVRLA